MHRVSFILIIFLASFLRLYNLSNNPVALNQDEAVNGYDAYCLGTTLRDHHGNFMPVMLESFADWASPAITYLTIPFIKILGLTEFTTRLPVALLGIGTVALIYVLTIQLFSEKKLALLASFLMAVMPWHVALSRWAIPPSIVPFFVLLLFITILWFFKNITSINYIKSILVGVTAAILTYSYPTQKMFMPLLLFAIIFISLVNSLSLLIISKLALIILIYLVLVLPIYIITFSNPEKYNYRFSQVSIIYSEQNIIKIIKDFLLRYFRYLSPDFNFGLGDPDIMHHIPGFGSTYEFLSLFFYMGVIVAVYIAIKNESLILLDRSKALILLTWLFLSPVPASLTREYNHLLRVVHMLPVVILFIILGLQQIIFCVTNKKVKTMILLILIYLSIFNTAIFSHFYFYKYPEQSKEEFQYGVKKFMTYLIEREDKFNQVIVDNKINQPYIYYLFYSIEYNRQLLNYSGKIDASFDSKGNWKGVTKLGKYEFKNINKQDFATTQEIHKVSDKTKVWYRVYANQDKVWFVQRAY